MQPKWSTFFQAIWEDDSNRQKLQIYNRGTYIDHVVSQSSEHFPKGSQFQKKKKKLKPKPTTFCKVIATEFVV